MNDLIYWLKEEQRVWRWQMLIRFVYLGLGLFLGYAIGIN